MNRRLAALHAVHAAFVIALSAEALAASAAGAQNRPIPYLGLEFRWHRDRGTDRFLHVERVAPNGPAYQAGIRPDDLITHLGAVRVDFGDELDFLLFMRDQKPGNRLALTIIRAGKRLNLNAVLGQLPEAARPMWERSFAMAKQRRAAARSAKP